MGIKGVMSSQISCQGNVHIHPYTHQYTLPRIIHSCITTHTHLYTHTPSYTQQARTVMRPRNRLSAHSGSEKQSHVSVMSACADSPANCLRNENLIAEPST